MKIIIISGSMRDEAQTLKVCKYLEGRLKFIDVDIETEIVDLNSLELSQHINEVWSDGTNSYDTAVKLTNLETADGFVIATPEWNGMASAGLKNFFHHVGIGMAHKPGLLVSVSASRGGAFPIAELRMSSYKNSRINYIPDQLIVRDVNDVMNEDGSGDAKSSEFYEKQSDYSLKVLIEYAKALRSVRSSGVIDHDEFQNGMG